ncbi:hypothetical protein RMCBS344292_05736 [Rhizopus microsporus]|nr:hypothetical protein RMCBS344292_05736 [Rhizopus microsporus]
MIRSLSKMSPMSYFTLYTYRAKGHTSHFLHFIQSILPVIKPEFVVVTGDLTDAKDRKRITSQQYLDEWDVYQQAINEKVRVDWFDIRGNHDCFDLPSWKSRINYYRTHGQSASLVEQGKGIYTWQVNKKIGNYQFVAIDACPKRGPSRPLNFFGYLTSRTMDRLEKALTWKQFNHTFVFSHYPTTTMVFGVSNKGSTFRDLAKHYSIYFCGHLHRLIAGLGDVLQSYNTVTKSLELELGDMKEHGLYRVVAVDHDLISFTDLQLPLNQIPKKISSNKHGLVYPMVQDGNVTKIVWPEPIHPSPSILITNPKDARYSIPSKEPLWRIQSSTHIRFLIFSELEDPTQLKVSVYIDGNPHPHEATFVQDKLWTAPWNTSLLDPRTHHTLTICAETPDGVKGASTILFRVDGQRMNIGGGPGEFIIKSHMSSFLQFVTFLCIMTLLIMLILPKLFGPSQGMQVKQHTTNLLLAIHTINASRPSIYSRLKRQILVWTYRFLQLPSDQPALWYASFAYILYLMVGPWFRAEFIPSAEHPRDRYGTFYMWGMSFGQEWVPIADTWMFAAEQIFFDVFVFFILLVWQGADDVCCTIFSSSNNRALNQNAWFRGLEAIYWLWRSSELVALASFYGGIWPTLVQNVCIYWMMLIGGFLAFGRNGILRKKKLHNMMRFEGCIGCQGNQQSSFKSPSTTEIVTLIKADGTMSINSTATGTTTTTTMVKYMQNKEDVLLVDHQQISMNSGCSSGNSSSTPFDGQMKSRKKTSKT